MKYRYRLIKLQSIRGEWAVTEIKTGQIVGYYTSRDAARAAKKELETHSTVVHSKPGLHPPAA